MNRDKWPLTAQTPMSKDFGKIHKAADAHEDAVWCCAWSSQHGSLITGGVDDMIRVWYVTWVCSDVAATNLHERQGCDWFSCNSCSGWPSTWYQLHLYQSRGYWYVVTLLSRFAGWEQHAVSSLCLFQLIKRVQCWFPVAWTAIFVYGI